MVRARDNQIDRRAIREEIIQPQLGAAGRGAVLDDDPVVLGLLGVGRWGVMLVPGAVWIEGVWVDEAGCEGGLDQMRFADP